MSKLKIRVESTFSTPKSLASPLTIIVKYTREISSDPNPVVTAPAVGMFPLPTTLSAEYEIIDYASSTLVDLNITTEQGIPLIVSQGLMPSRQPDDNSSFMLVRQLTGPEIDSMVKAVIPQEPQNIHVLLRRGKFVTLNGTLSNARDFTFLVSPVDGASIGSDLLLSLFGVSTFSNIAKELADSDKVNLSRLPLGEFNQVPVKLGGEFEFSIPVEGSETGWVWLLVSQTKIFVGIHAEKSLEPTLQSTTIFLPFSGTEIESSTSVSGCQGSINNPIDATESELINNPEKFSDDPGSFCKPFVNPNRIVGERSFFTILRVTQPAIGGGSSYPRPVMIAPFPFSPTLSPVALESRNLTREVTPSGITVISRVGAVTADVARIDSPVSTAGASTASPTSSTLNIMDILGIARERQDTPAITNMAAIAQRRPFIIANSIGRHDLNEKNPLDWEGDSTIYQAESLAFGHILEFRVRWRSNGYSLGNIAHSLTLAPRQTRKIVTIQSKILDQARRTEATQSADTIAQQTSKNYSYTDAVKSGLSEWSKGGSESSTTGAAIGGGFAIGPFIVGGGASHGSSSSSSWQNGGRDLAATEEQSLRDSIRQYGESLRKFESVVVVEQSQEEFIQAVSEVVRNPNYCHSLTIVYHEILRHLRIDTEVVGARECLFVPLPIMPFTVERTLRWRDMLQLGLRKPELRVALQYLDEVASNFASGKIPAGPRYNQPINYLTGTIYLQLAIERPKDNSDGTFDPSAWIFLSRFLTIPATQIYENLRKVTNQMDAIYQRDYAPAIAAKWVNTLKFGSDAGYDFTLATKYSYNQVVRVNFTLSPQGSLTRSSLTNLILEATEKLTPGSVANVQKVELHYFTNTYDYRVTSASTADDLVSVDTGEAKDESAQIFLALTDWEKQDMQQTMRDAVAQLVTHLNEHIEYYNKWLWWNLDRDKLYMMLDSLYVRGETDGRSVASVVEREPVAILGNSLVYRVASGAFLGIDDHKTPEDLNDYYVDSGTRSEPIRVSLPTSGLYAQSLMDECEACEEHFGSTDWILSDQEPTLTELTPDMLSSRRAQTSSSLTPSQLPSPIINLQNAQAAPAPTGLADILNAIQNPNSFRDMAGLAGTQANAAAAMQTAANLADQFGSKALDLYKITQAAKIAKEQMAVVDKAHQGGGIDDKQKQDNTQKILDNMSSSSTKPITVDDVRTMSAETSKNKGNILWNTPLGDRLQMQGITGTLADFTKGTGSGPSKKPSILDIQWPIEKGSGLGEQMVNYINHILTNSSGSDSEGMAMASKLIRDITSYLEGTDKDQISVAIGGITAIIGQRIFDIIKNDVSPEKVRFNFNPTPDEITSTEITSDSTTTLPTALIILAKRVGTLLGLLQLAIEKASSDEHNRLEDLKAQMAGFKAFADIMLSFIPVVGEVAEAAKTIFEHTVSGIFDITEPNYEGQFDTYVHGLRAFMKAQKEYAKTILKQLFEFEFPDKPDNPAFNLQKVYSPIESYSEQFASYVLYGLEAELDFVNTTKYPPPSHSS